MSSLDRAKQLRAEADEIEAEALAGLVADLADAKAAYASSPNDDAKAAKQTAMEALRAARSATRPEGVSVGGDAFIETEV